LFQDANDQSLLLPSAEDDLFETSESIGELGKHSIFEKGQSGLHIKDNIGQQVSTARIVPKQNRSFMVNYHKKLQEQEKEARENFVNKY
jgi:hypothetical protein